MTRVLCYLCAATIVAGGTAGQVATAGAETGVELNGRFVATSDGQWATSNERYHDESTVVSTWTVTSSCENFQRCTGTVTSDSGWTAQARYYSGQWLVTRAIPDWEPCPDGSTAEGTQRFSFWPDRQNAAQLIGWDKTLGPSGACGKNRSLAVEMPFTLVPVPG